MKTHFTLAAYFFFHLTCTSLEAQILAPVYQWSDSAMYSSERLAGETYEEGMNRVFGIRPFDSSSAEGSMQEFGAISDVSTLPEWPGTIPELALYFAYSRDERVYNDGNGFLRRSTWLYPEDGCFARAEHVARSFASTPMPRPGKLFAFGRDYGQPIGIYSRFSRNPERKTWWLFHVAPAYRKGKDVIVLDPSIDPVRPLKIRNWLAAMARDPQRVKVSLCDTNAYTPMSRCIGGQSRQEQSIRDQLSYLTLEWNRVLGLDLKPEKLLGSEPPWLSEFEAR